ncbi:MAG: extracellular solute-binding protein [Candidatus Omnitrophota bacterium]|nr:extracellular solute-binding protein [Candidatus Omnitrophota bacterium]
MSDFFKRILLLFCIFSFTLMAGCGQKEPLPDKQQLVKTPQELVMWLVGPESQAKEIQKIGNEFFKDKNIIFKCQAISWGDAHTKYLTCIAGDIVPDIGTMGLTWGTEFGHLGAMVNLTEEFGEDLEEIRKKTFSGLWDTIDRKGEIYGIPFDISLQIMFYRNDIIPRSPATWKELKELLKKLKTQGKGMIFDWGSMSWIGLAPYLWQAGGDFYNPEGTKSTLSSPEAVEALEFFAGLYTELGVPKARIPVEQGMRTGEFPLAISGNWKIDSLRLSAPEIEGKWSIALLPAGPADVRTTFLGGRIMGIFDKSKNKPMAWEFIKFLFLPQTQIRLYKAARKSQDSYLPSNKISWNTLPMELKFKQVLKLQAVDGAGPPSILGWDESTRFIEQAIQRVVLQGADAQEELDKAVKEIDRKINKHIK